jgi:hypothetical protein
MTGKVNCIPKISICKNEKGLIDLSFLKRKVKSVPLRPGFVQSVTER